MDTLIKVTLEKCDYQDKRPMRQPRSFYLDLTDRDKSLFQINEADYTFAVFDFNPAVYEVSYENYDDGEPVQITSGKRFCLSYGREDYGSYYPGRFTLWITKSGERREYLFDVLPSRLDMASVLSIRKYVNDFYYGLSSDLLKRSRLSEIYLSDTHTGSLSENILFMKNNMGRLLSYTNQYLMAMHTETEKRSLVTNFSSRIGPKSIQWLSRKGMAKNKNIYSPDKILVKKTVFNLNNPQNQMFKGELQFWNYEFRRILVSMEKTVNSIREKLIMLNNNQDVTGEHLKDVTSERQVSMHLKKTYDRRMDEIEKDIGSYEKTLSIYRDNIRQIRHFKTNLEFILFNTWVRDVDESREPVAKVTDNRLKLMLNVRNEYLGIKKRGRSNHRNSNDGFGEKCTPKLFETFIYILIIDLLKEAGYELMNIDIESDDLMLKLSDSSVITLRNEDQYCDIIYDHELRRNSDELSEGQYVWINSEHHRPDFILSFRNGNDVVRSVVVEVKWRPLSAIYNPVDDTDITRTLKDYYQLSYYNSDRSKVERGVISKVLVVYPDASEKVTEIMGNEILSIGLKPDENISSGIGYSHLKDFIMEEE